MKDAHPGQAIPTLARDPSRVLDVPRQAFSAQDAAGRPLAPRVGRFYPSRCLRGVPAAGPFRVLHIDAESLRIDTNDPWAGFDRHAIEETWAEMHCACAPAPPLPVVERLARAGCPLQAVTSFDEAAAGDPCADFRRADDAPDKRFYARPRFVQHVDGAARAVIAGIHRRCLSASGTSDLPLLDLMSGFATHLPPDGTPWVTGLGINAEELAANGRLSGRIVADLNARPSLPFADASFGASICALSVEYLVRPVEVFREVGRVLARGAPFVLSWSERWFPGKAIAIWGDLHPGERVARIVRQLLAAEAFEHFETESRRGLARSPDDRYAGRLPEADPVYAVVAYRR